MLLSSARLVSSSLLSEGVMSKLVNVRTGSELRLGLFVFDVLPGR